MAHDDITIRRLTPELPDDYLAFFDGPAFFDNPEWRGRGIGTRLLEAAMDDARATGMARLAAAPLAEAKTHPERFRGSVSMFEAAGYEKVTDLPGGAVLMEKKR